MWGAKIWFVAGIKNNKYSYKKAELFIRIKYKQKRNQVLIITLSFFFANIILQYNKDYIA